MNDMSSVIVPKSDQINADDLIGRNMTITIRDVQIRGGQEQPVSIYFEGSDKAFRPCKSMSRVLVYCWGADAKQYIGRSLSLYRDPNVKWGGMAVGGIRISHASHLDGDKVMVLAESKASRKPYTVKPLVLDEPTAAKPDKVADGVKAMLERIAAGEDIDDDAAVTKQRKWLETNRPELFAQIEAALQARDDDPFSGPSDAQRGETHATTIDEAHAATANLDDLALKLNAARAEHGDLQAFTDAAEDWKGARR